MRSWKKIWKEELRRQISDCGLTRDFPIARKHRHATYAVYPRRARTPCCGLRTFGNSANDRLFYEAILRPLLNDFGGREPGLG